MTVEIDLKQKVAVVTGAGRGIGRAIALTLAEAGASVLVNDIDAQTAAATVEQISTRGGKALAHAADVSNRQAVQEMVAATTEHWGRLDILVNNAAIEPTASILTLEEETWDRVLAVNLKGTFLCTQAAGRIMQTQGHGAIINIASIAGKAIPLLDRSAYCASKAGQVGFTREAAREFAQFGVRVNAVCPGVIITPMTDAARQNPVMMERWRQEIPQRRLGEAEEVANLVLFLASEAASYITGQAYHVDGGKVMA